VKREDAINLLKIKRDAINIKVAAPEYKPAAALVGTNGRTSAPPVTQLLPQRRRNQPTRRDTWSRNEYEDQSPREGLCVAKNESARRCPAIANLHRGGNRYVDPRCN
jgi:hypothetical protein